MRRRKFIQAITAFAAWPFAARAQHGGKIPRVGFMGNSTAALEANLIGPFREGLREHGYQEGRNVEIVYRWAEGRYERFPDLIAELIAANVDIIVTAGTPAALAVKKATSTVPVVMAAVGDPVGTGIVRDLARPGGNITGLSGLAPDLEGKRLELLREVVPHLAQVAFFLNPANEFHTVSMRQALAAAQALNIKLQPREVRKSEDLDTAFDAIVKEQVATGAIRTTEETNQDINDIPDDRLRLMFTCCHPALAPDSQIPLTLRMLGGLETNEIARAFLTPVPTMASSAAPGRASSPVATAETAAVRISVTADALTMASGSPVSAANSSTPPWCVSLPTAGLPGVMTSALSP